MSRRGVSHSQRVQAGTRYAQRHAKHHTQHRVAPSKPFSVYTARKIGTPKPHLTGKVVRVARVKKPPKFVAPVAYKSARQARAAMRAQMRKRAKLAMPKTVKPVKLRFTKNHQPIAPGYHQLARHKVRPSRVRSTLPNSHPRFQFRRSIKRADGVKF